MLKWRPGPLRSRLDYRAVEIKFTNPFRLFVALAIRIRQVYSITKLTACQEETFM